MTTYLTTRKGNKLQLNGNRISGDTYPIKDALKKYCGAHDWNGMSKSWAVDLDKLNQYMSIANSIGLHVDNSATVERTEQHTNRWLNADGSLAEDY